MYKYIEPHTPVPGDFLRRRSGFGYVSLFLCPLIKMGYLYVYMKLIDTIQDILIEQVSKLTVPEQTLLGFLNRFLKGEKGEFENTPIEQLKKTMLFNSKTIYPMAQKLLEKKSTGKKTYDDKTFNSLFMSMDKSITKEQRYEFFNEGGSITKITYNSQF